MTRTDTNTEIRDDLDGTFTVQVSRWENDRRTTTRTSRIQAEELDEIVADLEAGWTLTRTRVMTVENMTICRNDDCRNKTIRLNGLCPTPHN